MPRRRRNNTGDLAGAYGTDWDMLDRDRVATRALQKVVSVKDVYDADWDAMSNAESWPDNSDLLRPPRAPQKVDPVRERHNMLVDIEIARTDLRRRGRGHVSRPDLGLDRPLDAEEVHRYEQADLLRPLRQQSVLVPIMSPTLGLFGGPSDLAPGAMDYEVRTVTLNRPAIPQMRRSDRRTADAWIKLATTEAVDHAKRCMPAECACPNCEQYNQVRLRALKLYRSSNVELSLAWHVALDEATGGEPVKLRSTPPRMMYDESEKAVDSKVQKLADTRIEPLPEKTVVVSNPSTSAISKRFGGLDL